MQASMGSIGSADGLLQSLTLTRDSICFFFGLRVLEKLNCVSFLPTKDIVLHLHAEYAI